MDDPPPLSAKDLAKVIVEHSLDVFDPTWDAEALEAEALDVAAGINEPWELELKAEDILEIWTRADSMQAEDQDPLGEVQLQELADFIEAKIQPMRSWPAEGSFRGRIQPRRPPVILRLSVTDGQRHFIATGRECAREERGPGR